MEGTGKIEICGVDFTDYFKELSKQMANDENFKKQVQKGIERSLEDIRGIKLEFELMDPNAKLPSYAHDGDAGAPKDGHRGHRHHEQRHHDWRQEGVWHGILSAAWT